MLNIKIFIILAFSISLSLYSAENTNEKSSLVFSEMTIDAPPGDDGSWIELYNRSEKVIKIDGYTIVCNNKKVFAFPAKNLTIGAKEILLIRFNKKNKDLNLSQYNLKLAHAPVYHEIVKTDVSKIKKKGAWAKRVPVVKERSPGYCALFATPELSKNNIVDYVSWGRSKFIQKYSTPKSINFLNWAIEKKLQKSKNGIQIGIDPLPGDPLFAENISINRKLFAHVNKPLWSANEVSYATPGKGNYWNQTLLLWLNGGIRSFGEKLKVSTFYDKRINKIIEFKKLKTRLQIAKDPHFEEIIYNKLIPPKTTIDDYDFKAGTYFARVRIDTDKVNTNWSPAATFQYVDTEENKDEK